MEFYIINLTLLIAVVVGAAISQYQHSKSKLATPKQEPKHEEPLEEFIEDTLEEPPQDGGDKTDKFFRFRNRFLAGYGLAIAADWLQGPFLYKLYKNTHQIPDPTIAALFATGFLCGGISAPVVGHFADRFGRKLACLSYCLIYSMSCLTMLSGNHSILFIGRALGGISTTLLFTTFEAWMVAEYNRLGFGESEYGLSFIYSSMSILNGFIAVICGVAAQLLVQASGQEVAPFLASIACLACAAFIMSRYWSENYGSSKLNFSSNSKSSLLSLSEPGIWAMTFAVCILEGTMYIMVYSWSQAIISSRELSGSPDDPPFGLIFSNFMCALTLGSFLFAYLTRHDNSILLSSQVVQLALSVSACSILLTVLTQIEVFRFWGFCLFEFCLGMYFPSMAYLKARIVKEEERGKMYGLMRIPLNIFVLIALGTVSDGDSSRENRFILCSILLLISIPFVARCISPMARSR